uniref:DUF19 domain-containing protein n=1 Tax=Syphacia muris TaxID=451379 RepID=A0A0N5A804_9BILA
MFEEMAQNVTRPKLDKAISIPKIGGQVFQELCSVIRDFNKCAVEIRDVCPKHIMITLIDTSYGYLCNEGYEAFMSNAECLMDLDRKPSVKYCHDETLLEIERVNTEVGITLAVKLDRLCEALNFFSGCVRLPIRHNCGVDAWSVIFRVLRDTTNSLLPECQFTGQSRKLFSTTQTTPLKSYKPTILLITSAPKITSNFVSISAMIFEPLELKKVMKLSQFSTILQLQLQVLIFCIYLPVSLLAPSLQHSLLCN